MIVVLPKLAETTDVVVVVDVMVAVGDRVSAGDPLVSVETDKVTVEVPSPRDGVVQTVFVSLDDEVRTGEPVCEVAT